MKEIVSFKIKDNLAYDIPAAVVVFLVALPLCLGIALASGAPLFSGLVAGVVGGIVAGIFGGSQVSVSGPAAGLATIVFASIQELGTFQIFLGAVVVAGLIQILFGFLRAGTIGHFFPASVIKGMLAAIGLILILKQIPHAFGYDADFEGDESFIQPDGRTTFSELLHSFEFISAGPLIIAVTSLIILIVLDRPGIRARRWASIVPAPLLVVIMGIAFNLFFQKFIPGLKIEDSHLVQLPGFDHISDLGGMITFPDFSQFGNLDFYRIAITIALVASLESLLSIEACDKLDPFKRITPLNSELKAQGLANLTSGLLGGLPVTAVIVRSSANIHAGARTKLSAILHGVILCGVVVSVPGLLQLIPLASLAAILIMVGYKLTNLKLYRQIFAHGWDQFIPFVVTTIAILFSDILVGIGIGILVSIFFVLKSNFQSTVILVNLGNRYLLKFTKDASFLHKSSLRKAFERIPEGSSLVIDMSKSQFMDFDILETIDDFVESAPSKKIEVELKKSNNDADNSYSRKKSGTNNKHNVKKILKVTEVTP